MTRFAQGPGKLRSALLTPLPRMGFKTPGEPGCRLRRDRSLDHVNLTIRHGRHKAVTLAGGWTAPS